MGGKRIKAGLLLIVVCLIMTGCRTRTTGSIQENASRESSGAAGMGTGEEQVQDEVSGDETRGSGRNMNSDVEINPDEELSRSGDSGSNGEANWNEEPIGDEEISQEDGEPGNRTKENPEAHRKEYDENAAAEIVPGTDHLLHEEGEGSGAAKVNEEAAEDAAHLNEEAEEITTRTIAAQEAEEMGVSEDAEKADSALTYFTVLLRERTGSLFECQKANVYWESVQDHVTIHKSAPEHTLILDSGCYDVSSKLLPENLRVDDGWVVRKNPQVIVKIVDSGVLGGGVSSTRAAGSVYQNLADREGWEGIDAVRGGKVLLLSQELLEAPYLQTAAMLLIAWTANPSLFEDTDMDEALEMLAEEATGAIPTGIYYYSTNGVK